MKSNKEVKRHSKAYFNDSNSIIMDSFEDSMDSKRLGQSQDRK